jgi:cytochrome P450
MLSRLHGRYGDAFSIDLPLFGPSVILSNPAYVKRLFQAKPDEISFGERSPLGKVLGPGSLFSLDGSEHLAERRLILPAFHGERMKSYEGIIEEEALREMASWPEGREFPTLEPFMRITLNSILRAVFGAEGKDVAALDIRTFRHDELRRSAGVLPEREHYLVRIRHAPNREMRRELLVLRRMDPVREPEGARAARRAACQPAQKACARFSHFSRSFSFGLIGVPGWIADTGHFSAACTSCANVPAWASLTYACLFAL